MTKKRKTSYPPPRSSKGPAPAYTPPVTPPSVAIINKQAVVGGGAFTIGMKVVIGGTGLYTGEIATVESLVGGVIPAAVVRTSGGQTRRVRTIDLTPAPAERAKEPERPSEGAEPA